MTPANILHGTTNHPDLHNPLTLRVRVDRTTRFEIAVGTVSGYGGANLRAKLDGASVLSKDFGDPDGSTKTDDLHGYSGTFPITLTTGVHTLKIENTGADWVKVGYRLVGVVPRKTPPLNAWAIVGDGTAIAWVRGAGRTWGAVAGQKRAAPSVPPTVLRFRGLRSGRWRAEIWNTWTGRVESTTPVSVGIDGGVRVALPQIAKDVAIKVVREG